jgi:hypothetical protein
VEKAAKYDKNKTLERFLTRRIFSIRPNNIFRIFKK